MDEEITRGLLATGSHSGYLFARPIIFSLLGRLWRKKTGLRSQTVLMAAMLEQARSQKGFKEDE